MSKYISIITSIAVFLLLVVTVSTVAPVSAEEPPKRSNPVLWGVERTAIEDVSSRTQNSKVFDHGNGSYTAILSEGLHYLTASGDWRESNLDYRGDGSDNVMDRHPRYEARVTESGISIAATNTGKGIRWITPARPSVSGKGAVFSDNGVIWTYTNTDRGLKAEGLILSTVGPKTYTFNYELLGGAAPLSQINGSLWGDGYNISQVVIIGNNGITYPASSWNTMPASNQIAFTFDDTKLPAAAYPYVIDPTTILTPGSGTYSKSTTPTVNNSGSANLFVGDNTGASSAYRTSLKFDTSSIDSGATVTSATLELYENSAGDLAGIGSWATPLQVMLVDWVESQLTWNNYKTGTPWPGSAGASTDGVDRRAAISATVTLDGTAANAYLTWSGATLTQNVQDFVDGSLANYGWLLSAPAAEFNTSTSGNAFTSDNGGASQHPKLTVVYTLPGYAALTGTIGDGATEQEVRDGGGTILVTLTNDTWVADGATFNAQRQAIIDGLDAASSPTNGWNNEVRDSIGVASVVRTSDTLATITLTASEVAGYAIVSNEIITMTVPASALTAGVALTATPTITITAGAESAAITGTIGGGATEQAVRDGNGTIVITLTNTTWVPAAASEFDNQRQNIIDGLVAADSQTYGWNNEVKAKLGVGAVVRTSDTLVTITIPAGDVEDYRIVTNEVITTTVPATAMVFGAALVATPTTTITGTVESAAVSGTLGGSGGTAAEIEAGGETVIITLTNTTWVTAGATFNAQRQNILDGLVADDSDVNGWNAMAFAVGDVVRTSGTIVTITLSAESAYAIPSAETITTTVPASAIVYGAALVAPETFTITPNAFATSGTRVSTAIDLQSVTELVYCAIGWEATSPTNTTVAIETSIDGGANYSTAINGSCPTDLTVGESLATITDFRVKATLTTTDTSATPLITALGLIVEDAGGSELCYQLVTTPSATLADSCGIYNGTMSFPIGPSTITSSTDPITSTAASLPNARALAGQDVAQAVTGSATSASLFPAAGDEGGFAGLPLNNLVNEMSTVGDGLPVRFVWFIFLGIATIGAGMLAIHLTSNLFIAAGAMAAVMGFQMAIGSTGLLPGWILFAFIPLAAAFLLFRRGFPV